MLNLSNLATLVAILDKGSFTAAAGVIGCTPSAVSLQVKQLETYFGKPLRELSLPEIALMVAIVRGPSYYDPRRHEERARARRNLGDAAAHLTRSDDADRLNCHVRSRG